MSTIAASDHLYGLATRWTAHPVIAENTTVEDFSAAVGILLRNAGERLDSDYWQSIARPLRALRWRLATVPLPVNSPGVGVQAIADLVIPRLRRCHQITPDLAMNAEALADELEHLWACGDDPLGDVVRLAVATASAPAILLIDGRAVPPVSEAFPGIRVMTSAELMRTAAGEVVAVGPSAKFPRRILQAPRAEHFTFIRYGWIRDQEPDLDLLAGTRTHVRQALAPSPARAPRPDRPQIDAEDLAPRFEWRAINRAARRGSDESYGEPVAAQLFVLASDQGVYMEAREGAKAIVAEIEDELVVRQELINELAPGALLVVRTEGDADYVRVFADQQLGARAPHLRELQHRMKRRLNAEIESYGTALVARKLKRLGSPIATENNLRRWAEPSNITTNDYADFAAICELIGEENADGMWTAMRELRAAHIRAGNEIRKLLVAELQKADISRLLQDGWADYDVEEIEGEGSLRVAAITGKAPDETDVPRSRLRKAFDIGGDLWLG